MDMETFAKKICTAVKEKLGGKFRTEIREVRKNNGILLHGLLISPEGQTVVPTIYLEPFLKAYETGMTFDAIICRLIAVYRKSNPEECISMDFFRLFQNVKDKICYRLVCRKGNEELLEEIPYIEFLDLAVCFYYAYYGKNLGNGTILIYNSHMEMWGTSGPELFRLAERNTQRLFPWECSGMDDMLKEMSGSGNTADTEDFMEAFCREVPMKILTNSRKMYGAACILYPGVLDGIAEKTGGNLFIIPSSVHETILLPDTGKEDPEKLKEMVRSVNDTQVAPEEVLSDTLYRYDAAEKKVVIA